jgi:hypothetical protein
MAKGKTSEDLLADLVAGQQTQLIVNLAMAGLTQHQIRRLVGVQMNRVGRIVKQIKKAKGGQNGKAA